MTVYTDEVNIYNTDAIAQGIEDAENAYKTVVEVDTNGIRLHPAEQSGSGIVDYTQIDTTGVRLFKNDGSGGSKQVAKFGDTVTIGKPYVSGATDNESRMELDYHSMQLYDKENDAYFHVSDLRNADGSMTETFTGNGSTKSFTLMSEPTSTGYTVKVNGVEQTSGITKTKSYFLFSTAPADGAAIEVSYMPSLYRVCKALTFGKRGDGKVGLASSAFGWNNVASNTYSHAEGYGCKATGKQAHAEGGVTTAQGDHSHAEGYDTQASKERAHAEGYMTEARGQESHAEGNQSKAIGNRSHAQNECTVAGHANQTTIGMYNDNQSDNAFEIGNGTSDSARSNAFTVDWDGNVEAAGNTVHAAYANAITSTTISATNTAKQIPITSIYDGGSPDYFVHASNGIKVLKAGTYIISVQAASSNATSGDLMGLHVYKNGSSIIGPEYRRMGGTYDTVVIAPTMAKLSEGDVLTVYGRNNTAARGTFSSLRIAVIRL